MLVIESVLSDFEESIKLIKQADGSDACEIEKQDFSGLGFMQYNVEQKIFFPQKERVDDIEKSLKNFFSKIIAANYHVENIKQLALYEGHSFGCSDQWYYCCWSDNNNEPIIYLSYKWLWMIRGAKRFASIYFVHRKMLEKLKDKDGVPLIANGFYSINNN